MSDDVELLRRWREGDEEAASRLLRRHFSRVFNFFRSKLDSEVEDLTQRTFLACVESRDRLDDDTSFAAYLLGIARKQLLFHLRTKLRRDRRIELATVSAVDLAASPSVAAVIREEQELLLAALRRIPIDLQIAIELFYFEEMPGHEIAAVLEIPVGTVRSRLRRAKEALRAKLLDLDAPDDLKRSTVDNLEQWAEKIRKTRLASTSSQSE